MRVSAAILVSLLGSGCSLLFSPTPDVTSDANSVSTDAAIVDAPPVGDPDADSYAYPVGAKFACPIFSGLRTEFNTPTLDPDWSFAIAGNGGHTIENGELTLMTATSGSARLTAATSRPAHPASVAPAALDIRVGPLSPGAKLTYRWQITNIVPTTTIDVVFTPSSIQVIHGGVQQETTEGLSPPYGVTLGIPPVDPYENIDVGLWIPDAEVWDLIAPPYLLGAGSAAQILPSIFLESANGQAVTATILSVGAACN